MNLDQLTHENTQAYIGQTFHIKLDDGNEVELKLERIDHLMEKHLNPRMKRDAFALIFRGPSQFVLPQQIYSVENEKLGLLQMFLVPIGLEQAGALYEAVFN